MANQDMIDELKRHDIDMEKKVEFDISTTNRVVSYRLMKGGGREEEAEEAYSLFDKRSKSYINSSDLKNTLNNYLGVYVPDSEIQEFIKFCGVDGKMG